MEMIKNGFEFIVNFFKTIGNLIQNIFEMNMKMTTIGIAIMQKTGQAIANMPQWLQYFAILTLSVSLLYLIIGRNAGKRG